MAETLHPCYTHWKKYRICLIWGGTENLCDFQKQAVPPQLAANSDYIDAQESLRAKVSVSVGSSDSLSPMLLKITEILLSNPQMKQNAPQEGRMLNFHYNACQLSKQHIYYDESPTHIPPHSAINELWWGTAQETSSHFFRRIGESESENRHLARLWREGFPERQFSRA